MNQSSIKCGVGSLRKFAIFWHLTRNHDFFDKNVPTFCDCSWQVHNECNNITNMTTSKKDDTFPLSGCLHAFMPLSTFFWPPHKPNISIQHQKLSNRQPFKNLGGTMENRKNALFDIIWPIPEKPLSWHLKAVNVLNLIFTPSMTFQPKSLTGYNRG